MDLAVVLSNAQNPNPAIRNQAEAQLNEAVEKQYGPFLIALCTELATEGKPDASRQLAGLYLKNIISAQDETLQEQKKEKWVACDNGLKTQIRASFLHALQSPITVVCHTAAQVTSAFGAIDLPTGQWPALLPTLFHNVSSPDVGLPTKVGSLEVVLAQNNNILCNLFNVSHVHRLWVICAR
jgi:importin subunit beta-1